MRFLGIDSYTGRVAEGPSETGRYIYPPPIIVPAHLASSSHNMDAIRAEFTIEGARLVFREDSFDPVTRIRRGRLYRSNGGTQPSLWKYVQGDPSGVSQDSRLFTFQSVTWAAIGDGVPYSRARLALGAADSFGTWTIVMAERISVGCDLFTLRSQSTFGLLPTADELAIPLDEKRRIQEGIDSAVDAAHRQLPDATIDACRHAAVVALSAWGRNFIPGDKQHSDLGNLLNLAEKNVAAGVMVSCGRIIQRLHSRTKPNERRKYGLRPNEDFDGEAATNILGLFLRELREPPRSPTQDPGSG